MQDQQIRDILGRAVGQEPAIVGGPGAAFERADGMIRRRRIRSGALSSAAVLGMAAAAIVVASGGPAPTTVTEPGAGVAATPTTPVSGLPGGVSRTPHSSPAPVPAAGQVLIGGRTALELVRQVLPATLTSSQYRGLDTPPPQLKYGVEISGRMQVDDGRGPAEVGIGVQQHMSFFGGFTCRGFFSYATDCRQHTMADGSVVLVHAEPATKTQKTTAPGAVTWSADRLWPNGNRVHVEATNYTSAPSAKQTRAEPPLTLDQLAAIVEQDTVSPAPLTVPATLVDKAKQDIAPYTDLGGTTVDGGNGWVANQYAPPSAPGAPSSPSSGRP